MFNLNPLGKIVIPFYLFIYLIFPYSAITETTKSNFRKNLENALNTRDLEFIKASFKDTDNLKILNKFSKIVKEFPDTEWKIKRMHSKKTSQDIFQVKVKGKKIVNRETYTLESNFNYVFSTLEGKINKGYIKNLFTTIRTDSNKIDISFRIPDQVLTGTNYDIDIILNEPLEDVIIAGGIKPHQEESFIKQEIAIEPLVSGGIFKKTRAPSKPGTQIWSGIIAHPKGMITFTKSVDIVDEI